MKAPMLLVMVIGAFSVSTNGKSANNKFVCEWGKAQSELGGGKKVEDKHLTVWQKK
jgi:hypothetical protein